MNERQASAQRTDAQKFEQEAAVRRAADMRQRAIAEAEHVATVRGGKPLDAVQRERIAHVVDLASAAPEIAIYWMRPGGMTEDFVGSGIANSFNRRRAIVVPAVVALDDYMSSLHELGHVRTGSPS